MKVKNIHKRILKASKQQVEKSMLSLSKVRDEIWPLEKWPAMKFKEGIKIGAKGGHGPIRYTVEKYDPTQIIEFRFSRPRGFDGIHKFEISELSQQEIEITHTIAMETSGKATLTWIFVIRPLHNALMEDAFNKLENGLSNTNKKTKWNIWVKMLRGLLP
ncbi:hypothetical protein [Arcticibacterium luteifluviistationis]|uniref:SRPBCC family protein n=1 Tax=Arcticibacterium luteifluviistationis TaxID=1784714 RepID=A0A2Z4G7B4_9BACT|nr:hypothetical protein [Arcticibacterium luteifluviistationis]AWV97061.1 hypothetical protein DJ013_02260 [Arcticibacterium luteifluviistationis]